MPGEPSRCRSGGSHEALGNERPRGMAIAAAATVRRRHRTRLIRRLAALSRTLRELFHRAVGHSAIVMLRLVTEIAASDYIVWSNPLGT